MVILFMFSFGLCLVILPDMVHGLFSYTGWEGWQDAITVHNWLVTAATRATCYTQDP